MTKGEIKEVSNGASGQRTVAAVMASAGALVAKVGSFRKRSLQTGSQVNDKQLVNHTDPTPNYGTFGASNS